MEYTYCYVFDDLIFPLDERVAIQRVAISLVSVWPSG